MAGKSKVPLFQAPQRFVTIEPGATVGATFGVDLRWPNGSLVKEADFSAGSSAPDSPVSKTLWSLIYEIPPNVTALETATGTGLFVVTGSGTGVFRAIDVVDGELTIENADGVDDNPTLGLADVTDAGGGTLQKTAFDAKGRKTGTSAATTTDLPEGTNLYFTAARVRATVLTGLSLASSAAITAADTVLSALGKLQAQITALASSLTGYVPTSRTISTTAPLGGGGDLSANRTLTISAASGSAAGSMSSANFTKLAGIATGATAYTDALARAAVITSTITNGDTTHAPSGDAVFDALAAAGLNTTSNSVANLDTMVGSVTVFFRAVSGATGIPSEVAGAGGIGWYIPYSGTIGSQFWHATTSNRLFMRGYSSGWNAWREIQPAEDTGWIAPTLSGTWANYGGAYTVAGYRRVGNRVFLQGLVAGGATGTTTVFTLPSGYRPTGTIMFPLADNSSTADKMVVTSAGVVELRSLTSTTYVSLSGISFFVD